jgi:hypothetical protein
MTFKLFVCSFGFYLSALLSLEIISDKTDDPCNFTQASSWQKLLRSSALKIDINDAVWGLLETISNSADNDFIISNDG